MKTYKFKNIKKKWNFSTLLLKKDIPFKTKRIFMIYGNKNFIRGNHAHYKCSQFLVPIYGTMEVHFEDSKTKTIRIINYKKTRFVIKPKTWCKIRFLTNHSILMVFCDRNMNIKIILKNIKIF